MSPYTFPRSAPLAIDFTEALATAPSRIDVGVAASPVDAIERERLLRGPVLIDATGTAETVYGCGGAIASSLPTTEPLLFLASAEGGAAPVTNAVNLLVAWPLDFDRIEAAASAFAATRWGLVVPLLPALTSTKQVTERLVSLAHAHGAEFVAGEPLDIDAAARNTIASMVGADEELFTTIFDERDLEIVSAERHLAALAVELGMNDALPMSIFGDATNWSGAVLLVQTATRMFRMEHEVELAWALQRSARLIATLSKPISLIAETASLSIIEGLDDASLDILDEWLGGQRPAFVEEIHRRWRLRRDLYR